MVNDTFFGEFCYKIAPLLSEDISTSQATVSPNDHQVVDAFLDEVHGGLLPSISLPEVLAASTPDHGTTLQHSDKQLRIMIEDGFARVPIWKLPTNLL